MSSKHPKPSVNSGLVYIVSGLPRSGTSAMMGALVAGGLPGNYDAKHDAMMIEGQEHMEYKPNPKGFFEHPFLPWQRAEGYVTKVPLKPLSHADKSKQYPLKDKDQYRVVVMRRKKHDIEASIRAWGSWVPNGAWADYASTLNKARAIFPISSPKWLEVDYDDLVVDPRRVWGRLVDAGWPIPNRREFIDWIDPDLCRNRTRA